MLHDGANDETFGKHCTNSYSKCFPNLCFLICARNTYTKCPPKSALIFSQSSYFNLKYGKSNQKLAESSPRNGQQKLKFQDQQ